MELSLEMAGKLRDVLNKRLQDMQSFAKLFPLDEERYDVRIVLHPDEDTLQARLPSVEFSPWQGPPAGDQYVKRTPRTPSQREAPFDDWYPGVARRRHEPSLDYPDVNPNYPGLRRVPEIQDLVRRVAMKPETKERLEKVSRMLRLSHRLARSVPRSGHGYKKESEFLVEELIAHLKAEGFNGRHKVVRVINDIKKAMKSDGYTFKTE
jgi:hypothetical protein